MIESIIYGIINGALVALLATAIAMHYKVSSYFDFFLPSFVALGGYVQYICTHELKLPLLLSLLASGVVCHITAVLIDVVVLGPLHKREASRVILLLSSLGGYIVVINTLGIFFGSDTKVLRPGMEDTLLILGIQLPIIRLWILLIAVSFLLALGGAASISRFGRVLNAAFDSTPLLEACGYDRNVLRRRTYGVAGLVAGTCGALFAVDTGVEPSGAMTVFLLAATAVIVGGAGRLAGAVVASLGLSFLKALLIWVAPAQWSETLVFALLFCFVCLRPHGIFPLRHAEYRT